MVLNLYQKNVSNFFIYNFSQSSYYLTPQKVIIAFFCEFDSF